MNKEGMPGVMPLGSNEGDGSIPENQADIEKEQRGLLLAEELNKLRATLEPGKDIRRRIINIVNELEDLYGSITPEEKDKNDASLQGIEGEFEALEKSFLGRLDGFISKIKS